MASLAVVPFIQSYQQSLAPILSTTVTPPPCWIVQHLHKNTISGQFARTFGPHQMSHHGFRQLADHTLMVMRRVQDKEIFRDYKVSSSSPNKTVLLLTRHEHLSHKDILFNRYILPKKNSLNKMMSDQCRAVVREMTFHPVLNRGMMSMKSIIQLTNL